MRHLTVVASWDDERELYTYTRTHVHKKDVTSLPTVASPYPCQINDHSIS